VPDGVSAVTVKLKGVPETAVAGATTAKCGAAGAVTVSWTVVVWTSEPLVPVMVSVEVLAGVALVVATVNVEGVPGPIETGLNVGVAPVGRPLTVKPTVPVNPFKAEALTV